MPIRRRVTKKKATKKRAVRKVAKKRAVRKVGRRRSDIIDEWRPRLEGDDAIAFARMLESCGFFVKAPGRHESISRAIWDSKNKETRIILEFWQTESGGVGFRIETFDSPPPWDSYYTEGPFRSDPKSSAQFVEKLTKAAESFSKKTT